MLTPTDMTTRNKQKGFTLIELMIVVVIVGILAALAIPRFLQAGARAKQNEAKMVLKQIYVMEHTYRTEHDRYVWGVGASPGQNMPPLYVEVMLSARYSYTVTSTDAGATNFTATATTINATGLDDDATIDQWQINDQGLLQVVTDDVKG